MPRLTTTEDPTSPDNANTKSTVSYKSYRKRKRFLVLHPNKRKYFEFSLLNSNKRDEKPGDITRSLILAPTTKLG